MGTENIKNEVTLNDKFTLNKGRIFINGTQALVRILFEQKKLDQKKGLNTKGFVSGYRGSPVGGVDLNLYRVKKQLDEAGIVFQPGLNEDLAATSLWGTQQLDFFPDPQVDGVFGMWYGKGPGVDRAGDVLRHANTAGTHKNGGVLLVIGDDHPGKSSSVVNQSEPLLSTLNMPVLYPANVQEIIDFGLLGWQLSRYSGLWIGLKTVNETVEQTQTVDVNFDDLEFVYPERDETQQINITPAAPIPQQHEMVVKRIRLPLVHKFVKANGIDRTVWQGKGKLGLITSGKSYEDVLHAFNLLGLTQQQAEELGIGLYKVGCVWPLEPDNISEFCANYEDLLVIEEKTAIVEPQLSSVLYNQAVRPPINGKKDVNGNTILPDDIQLTPLMIIDAVMSRLKALDLVTDSLQQQYDKLLSDSALNDVNAAGQPQAMRLPYFCSGCPHNTSTKLPEGSLGMAGIGCHAMAVFNRKDTFLPLHMGGEGMNWAGAAHFSGTKHMFQNLGDGTYFHSGLLAIRGAVASGVNITYKILFNDAVAMTGGQPHDGQISPAQIIKQVLAENVKKVVLVSDQPEIHKANPEIPSGIKICHRDELELVQKELREIPGTTIMVYEQTCAAEKRRRRKKGKFPNPAKRMFINENVCESCGDCSVQSTCVSIQPKQTALGVKRTIDQSSCNKDYSCVKGFCPSFVTVLDAEPKKPQAKSFDKAFFADLPAPEAYKLGDKPYSVMITGIGGTGVVTVGAVIGMAAHIDNNFCSIYDMTGLSQKNGAVYSHLKIANSNEQLSAQKIGKGEADLVLGFDLVAALTMDAGVTYNKEHTNLIGNSSLTTTSTFQFNRDYSIQGKLIKEQFAQRMDINKAHFIDATNIAVKLCGDTIAANMFVVGFAIQKGFLPVSIAAMTKAIELNGVAIPFNLNAFSLGRMYAHNPDALQGMLSDEVAVQKVETLEEVIAYRQKLLTDYQNDAYASTYTQFVDKVKNKEQQLGKNGLSLTRSVAENLAKIMAYKDEYEVARLHSSDDFKRQLDEQFEPGYKLKFNLAPPLFSKKHPSTGLPMKSEYGAWVMKAFKVLASLKGLRGTALDVFGYTHERRQERALINEYKANIEKALAKLDSAADPDQAYKQAIQLANLPQEIRGYGHVKEKAFKEYEVKREEILAQIG